MASLAASVSEPLRNFLTSQVFDRLFEEGMALVEETAAYLDGPGRKASKTLERELALTYAASSMDLSTRLMQAASWLVMQKAVRDGDMEADEAAEARYRLNRGVPMSPDVQLDPVFRDLVARSESLFERLCRLDGRLYRETEPETVNPVSRQMETLQRAALSGAFDPLKVWKR